MRRSRCGSLRSACFILRRRLLDAAQLPVPASFQGRSYWPELRDGSSRDAVAISECVAGCTNPFHPQNRMGPRVLSVREARFKLVLHFDPPADHLYDLEADPGEHTPLPPEAEKPVRRRLLELAREHLQRPIDDGMRLPARLHELRLEWSAPAAKGFGRGLIACDWPSCIRK